MIVSSALMMVGSALISNSALTSRASFELRGYVPISCNASVVAQGANMETVEIVVAESCNTPYSLHLQLPADSKATRVIFGGRQIGVEDGRVVIPRLAFAGSPNGGERMLIEFSELGAAQQLEVIRLEALPYDVLP